MRSIKALSLFLFVIFLANLSFADSGAVTTDPVSPVQGTDPSTATASAPAPSNTAPAAKPAEPAVTLAAEKVDPAQVAKEEAAQAKVWAPPKKKKVPLVLQPFEFVISSVVDAICFWKKD